MGLKDIGEKIFGKVSDDNAVESVRKQRVKRLAYIIIIALAAFGLSLYSITISSTDITALQVFQTLINQIFPDTFDVSERTQEIVMKVYAPRVLMAICAGATLAVGGALTQTILKNPLATPYTLGVSSSAAFGAGMAIILGVSVSAGSIAVMANAFLFSLIPAAIILIASARRNMMATTMILIGVSLSYLFSAANTIMQYFGDAEAVKAAMFWAVGDLNDVLLSDVPFVFVTLIITMFASAWLMKDIDIMRMGDDSASALGVNVNRTRLLTILLACFSTAVTVSFVGAIGFVCLLAPQISRIFVGGNIRYLIPASAVTGALIMTLADIIAKDIISPIILPVGAITALIGAPILIYLLLRNRNMVVS